MIHVWNKTTTGAECGEINALNIVPPGPEVNCPVCMGLPPLDPYLNALLKYSGEFYGVAIEAGMRARYCCQAMQHIESAARQLHKFGTEAQTQLLACQKELAILKNR